MADAEDNPNRPKEVSSSWEGFVFTLVSNLILFVIFFTCFLIVRRHFIMTPRRSEGDPPAGFLAWIPATLRTPKNEILRRAGLDGYMVVYCAKMFFYFFLVLTFLSMVILAPIYATADGGLSGLDLIALSNVPLRDSRVWAAWVFTYLFSFGVYFLLDRCYAELIRTKYEFVKNHLAVKHYAVLIRRLPRSLRNDVHMGAYAGQIFGPVIEQAHVPLGTKKLHSLVDKREALLIKLEEAIWKVQNTDKPVTHRTGFLGLCGKKVNSVEYYTQQLRDMNDEIAAEQQMRRQPTDTGFLMFSNVTDQVLASRSIFSVKALHGKAENAPEPRDVLWGNLEASYKTRTVGKIIGFFLAIFVLFFWTIPVVFLSSLTTLENLNRVLPFLESVTNRGVLKGFLEGFLPTLALVIFMALLPVILRAICDLSKPVSQSDKDTWVMRKLFLFYFYNIFLVVTISGTIFAAVDAIAENPSFIVDSLASGLPSMAVFFSQYLMINAIVTLPLALLGMFFNPILTYLKYRKAKTDKAKREALKPANYLYDLRYSKMMMMFLLALVYSTMFPLINVFGALFFFMFWLVESYEIMHLKVQPYESEGKMFPSAHNRGVLALFVFQLTMAGIFGLKESAEPGALMVPLILLTIAYAIYAHRKYHKRLNHFSLDYALDLDALPRPVFGGDDHDYYDSVEDAPLIEPSIVHPDGRVEERRMERPRLTAQELAARQDNTKSAPGGTMHKLKEMLHKGGHKDTSAAATTGAAVATDQAVRVPVENPEPVRMVRSNPAGTTTAQAVEMTQNANPILNSPAPLDPDTEASRL